MDNGTCGDAAFFDLECDPTEDNLGLAGVYFMETANDFRMAKGSRFNFQIGGGEPGKTLNIRLVDALGKNDNESLLTPTLSQRTRETKRL